MKTARRRPTRTQLMWLGAFLTLPALYAGCRRGESPVRTVSTAARAETATSTAKPTDEDTTMETATFGAGCFWGVESAFREVPGVIETTVGYTGGTTVDPTYDDVCSKTTGHAEVVQVKFDPSQVSYEKLLETFFECHDPTQLNRQGPDYGDQYRSAIFYHSPEQSKAAGELKEKLDASGRFHKPIVTEITAATTFYRAEEYHQQYYEKRGMKPVCRVK